MPEKPWRQRLLATLPIAVTAGVYLLPVLFGRYVPGTNAYSLGRVMQIEWLVVASGLFIMTPLFFHAQRRLARIIRVSVACLLCSTFIYGAYHMDGWRGVLAFGFLLYFSYGGSTLFVRDADRSAIQIPSAIARWVTCIFTFFPLVAMFDLPVSVESWDGRQETLKLGSAFFSILLILELFWFSWLDAILRRAFGRGTHTGDGAEQRARHYRRLFTAARNSRNSK